MACRICCVSLFYADWYTCWKYNSMYDHYNSVKCCNSQDYQKEQLKFRFMKKWKRMEWNSWKWTLFDPFYIDGTYLLQYSWSIKGNDEERCFAKKLIRESAIWWKRIVETKSVNHFWACVLKYSKYTHNKSRYKFRTCWSLVEWHSFLYKLSGTADFRFVSCFGMNLFLCAGGKKKWN